MSAIRTVGDIGDKPFGLLEPGQCKEIVAFLKESAERCLLVAMAAVGLTSMLAGIVKIGMRPFALGLFAAVLIGGVSFALISLFGADLIAFWSECSCNLHRGHEFLTSGDACYRAGLLHCKTCSRHSQMHGFFR